MSDSSLVNVRAWVDPMKSHGWRQSGGVLRVPGVFNPLNLERPRAFDSLLEWESELPQACELELQLQLQPDAGLSPTGFPDETVSNGFCAGAFNGFAWDLFETVIAKFETGGGADARVFYSDVRPGRFALGVQQRVRVSIARWLRDSSYVASSLVVQGSIGPAQATDADPLTYTAAIQLPAAGQRNLTAPPGALWWDWQIDTGVASTYSQVIVQTPAGVSYKDTTYTAPIIYPPAAPYPWVCSAAPNLSFIHAGGDPCNLIVTFWVR